MGYENGKIYKLICSETGDIYIGSTIQPLEIRLSHHKSPSNTATSRKFIKPIIILIKNYPCNNKKELEEEEAIFIRESNCVNIQIPGRTQKEWREVNKEALKEDKKQYYQDNRETILEYQKKYQQDNKEAISEYHNQYQKQYHQDNKEAIRKRQKQYEQDNKDKFTKKYNCECGGKYTHKNTVQHKKSKKHQFYLIKGCGI